MLLVVLHGSTGTVVYGFTRPLLASRIYWPQNIETGNSPAESSREKDSVLEGLKTATLTVKPLMSTTGVQGRELSKAKNFERIYSRVRNYNHRNTLHPEQDKK